MTNNLVRWDPLRELDVLQTDISRLFNSFFHRSDGAGRWIPALDVVESEEEIVLRCDLPGLKEEEVRIEVRGGRLTIAGERQAQSEHDGEGYHRIERSFGAFRRTIAVPESLDPDQVKAQIRDGVLEVHIPKPAEPEVHRIEVETED
jgi:HSP20 family protein